MKRVAVAIVLLVVVVLVAGAGIVVAQHGSDSAGAAGGPTPVAPSSGAPATKPPEAGLARFYDQKIDWSDSGRSVRKALMLWSMVTPFL